MTGMAAIEVLSVIWPWILRAVKGGTAETTTSNSLPGVIVFNSAPKDWLSLVGSEIVIGSSRWLTMCTVDEVWGESGWTLRIVNCGFTSSAFQTSHLNCNTGRELFLSLHVTLMLLFTVPE